MIMVVSDNGASAEGGPTGTTNETQFFNNAPEPLEDSLAAIDELGGPKHFNHYPWGWTWAGNTPFRRWKRETYRGGVTDPFIVHWPTGIKSPRRDPPAVRPHHRHGPDRARRARHRAAGHDPRRDAVAASTASASRTPSTTPRRRAAARRSTSRCSATGRSTTTAGGRSARGPARRSPRPARASASRSPRRSSASSTPRAGSSTTSPRTRPRTTTSPTEHRDKLIELIALWYVEAGKYDVLPIDGSALARDGGREAADRRAPRPYIFWPGTQTVPFFAGPQGPQPAAHHHRRRRDPRRRRRGRPARAGHRGGRLHVLHQGRPAALHPQLRRPRAAARRVRRRTRCRRAATNCASSSSRPAQPDIANGKGSPGPAAALRRRRARRRARHPVHDPDHLQPRRADLRRRSGIDRSRPEYTAPFRFTGTLHTVTVDVSGELIDDPEASCVPMARQ